MRIYLNDMLYALSYALDCVEAEYLGAKAYHSERVAYICVRLGKACGLGDTALLKLAAAAVLHDNALTEYVSQRKKDGQYTYMAHEKMENPLPASLQPHCEMGERNVQVLPFYEDIQGAVLYHHEHADGSGAFGKEAADTPLFAQLIHLGDQLDNRFPLNHIDEPIRVRIRQYLQQNAGHLFCPDLVEPLLDVFDMPAVGELQDSGVRQLLQQELPHIPMECSPVEIEGLATVFARIIDYKSHFTCMHSLGIAQKAQRLGRYLGKSEELCTKLYLAGALHDIGKLTISNDILEKPGRLTAAEFDIVKTHAMATWNILQHLEGLDDVIEWASLHHEKLDGSGYPFGRTAGEMGMEVRLMACIDIYQALIEARPYKEGMTHVQAVKILQEMAEDGLLDRELVRDIDHCFAMSEE